jgi:hypothetical protein
MNELTDYYVNADGQLITILQNGFSTYTGYVVGLIQIDLYQPFFLFEEVKS